MRLGASLRSAYAVTDPREGARWMIERAAAAREADLQSLFVGDHHATGPASYYQNVAIMGRLLGEWSGSSGGPVSGRVAGVLMLLPLWPPVLAAELLGTLAALHEGPFVLQCAVGGGAGQFAAMGASLHDRARRFEAALEVIRRLLAGEAVDAPEPFGVAGARIAPRPHGGFEVWIGGAADAAIDRAARLGDAFICGPEATPGEARRLADVYRARCAAHGRSPRLVLRRDIHVGADAADAARVAGPVVVAGYRGFDPSALVVGGPDEVAAACAQFATAGYGEVLVRHLADDQAEVIASFRRLGAVRAALASVGP